MLMASSMSSRRRWCRHKRTVDDLPVEVLLLIFKRCTPLACYRSRMVCRRWRTAIDEMDEENRKAILGEGHARLFICDRRRAILEKFTSLPSCSTSVTDLTTARKSVFHADCYAHTALSNWAYRFDMFEWTRNFDIVEVWIQNFGSFLERDQVRIIVDATTAAGAGAARPAVGAVANQPDNGNDENKAPSNSPSPNSRQSPQSPHAYRSGGSSSGSLTSAGSTPYNLLPSSQKKSQMLPSAASTAMLSDDICIELTKLSDGRFEKLAEQLREVRPLHLVFNDHSYYQKRPTMLLFWFLKQLPNLRRLTLDSIQGDQVVELHKVFSVDGIDELNVIQPKENACITVNEGLLDAFLLANSSSRRRFRLRITGKTDIDARTICSFIRKWRNHRDVIPFRTILIDTACVRPSEFIHATKCPGCSDCGGEVLRHKPNGNTWSTKQLVFRHRKYNVWINYKCENGYLVFSYYDPKDSSHFTVKPVEPASTVVSFYSPVPIRLEKPEESDVPDHRTWPGCRKTSSPTTAGTATTTASARTAPDNELTVLQRIFALIRSSA